MLERWLRNGTHGRPLGLVYFQASTKMGGGLQRYYGIACPFAPIGF